MTVTQINLKEKHHFSVSGRDQDCYARKPSSAYEPWMRPSSHLEALPKLSPRKCSAIYGAERVSADNGETEMMCYQALWRILDSVCGDSVVAVLLLSNPRCAMLSLCASFRFHAWRWCITEQSARSSSDCPKQIWLPTSRRSWPRPSSYLITNSMLDNRKSVLPCLLSHSM